MLESESVMDVGRLYILGGIVQSRVTDPQKSEVEVVMEEVVIEEEGWKLLDVYRLQTTE